MLNTIFFVRKVIALQQKLQQTEHVALTSDLWTSKANEPVITITSHFLDENNKLQSFVLDTVGFDQEHSGDNLSSYFKIVAEKWNIDKKTDVIITDNAANITNAVEMSGFNSLRCTGHTLNLSANDILKNESFTKIEDLLTKCRKLVSHFKRSPKAQLKLNKIQERLNIKKHKMIQEVFLFQNTNKKKMNLSENYCFR